jgi:hypothetical protein
MPRLCEHSVGNELHGERRKDDAEQARDDQSAGLTEEMLDTPGEHEDREAGQDHGDDRDDELTAVAACEASRMVAEIASGPEVSGIARGTMETERRSSWPLALACQSHVCCRMLEIGRF